jgi:hypothetical protein
VFEYESFSLVLFRVELKHPDLLFHWFIFSLKAILKKVKKSLKETFTSSFKQPRSEYIHTS